jgi:ferric-dicitrate binding protein FerR (iron transport regulator)
MHTIPDAVAPEIFAGLVRGEKDALHRLFDEYAPSIGDSADAEVHADTATAHIVENLFDRVWNERASFAGPEALHDWLVRETHAMSARELARRASLRRFDEREKVQHAATSATHVEYDVAAGWAKLMHRIELEEVDPKVAAAERFEASRHGTAEHLAHVGEGVSWKIIAGAVLAVGAVAAALYWGLDRSGADFRVTRALADKESHAITTAVGERSAVTLGDGTKVMMAADDSMTVPKAFNRDMRAVGLVGAAQFTVVSNPKLPFQVRAGKMQIVATGTTFTVSAYKDAPVIVTVQEGTVQVTVGKNVQDVASGSGLMLSGDSVLTPPTSEQMDETSKWVDGRLVIANRTLRDALPVFRRWYHMDLRPEVALLDRSFSMSTRLDNADSAIVALEQAAHVKRIWVKQQMVVIDAPVVAVPATKKKK